MQGNRGVTSKSELLGTFLGPLSKAAPTCAGQYRAGRRVPPATSRRCECRVTHIGQTLMGKGFLFHESVASRITTIRQQVCASQYRMIAEAA